MKYILSLCLLVGTSSVFAQIEGTPFPSMDTQTVDNEEINIPNDVNDKYTLVALAYSKKAEKDLSTWFSPIYNQFLREATGVFASFSYDINVYFVPMFTGVKAAATGAAKKKAAKQLDPLLIPNILFYKGNLKPYKEALEFDKKDVPYLFLIDTDGNIAYATLGAHTEQKMEGIEEFLDSL